MNKYFRLYVLLFTILFIQNILHSQRAHCKEKVSYSISFICHANILPADIDSLSSGYDVLSIDKNSLELGSHEVKLYAIKDGVKTDSCTSQIVISRNRPILCGITPTIINMYNSNPIKLEPLKLGGEKYLDYCVNETVTISPEYIYCDDPAYKLCFVRYTYGDQWHEMWLELNIVKKFDYACDEGPKKADSDSDLIEIDMKDREAKKQISILKTEIYDLQGRLLKVCDSENLSLNQFKSAGIYIIKEFYTDGSFRSKKVFFKQ